MNFKIQMLAGKDTKSFFERFYKNHRTLVTYQCMSYHYDFLKVCFDLAEILNQANHNQINQLFANKLVKFWLNEQKWL